MSDELNLTPELTLTPDTAAAAAQAPAAPEAPSLTLESQPADDQAAQQAALQAQRDANAVKLDESMLSEAERKMVDEFSQKIDVTDSNMVLQYGAAAQKNIAAFSESALNNVKTKDLGEVGEALSSLVVELKNFGQEEEKKGGIFGFFQKKKNELEALKASYSKAEANVDKIVKVLENHQVVLMKDIAMFDQMYDLNTKYYKELTMYIIAGKKRLEYLRTHDLEDLRKKAQQTGAQEDAQAYNDFANLCTRFEKKLHDLELTRMISSPDGPPDPPAPEQRHPDAGEDPVLSGEHHPPVEKPDGAGPGPGARPSGHRGPDRRHQHDQRAAEEERRHAEDGHHRDRPGGRALRGGHRDPPAHQPAADLHPGRGDEDPDRGRARSARRPRPSWAASRAS